MLGNPKLTGAASPQAQPRSPWERSGRVLSAEPRSWLTWARQNPATETAALLHSFPFCRPRDPPGAADTSPTAPKHPQQAARPLPSCLPRAKRRPRWRCHRWQPVVRPHAEPSSSTAPASAAGRQSWQQEGSLPVPLMDSQQAGVQRPPPCPAGEPAGKPSRHLDFPCKQPRARHQVHTEITVRVLSLPTQP